MTIAETLLPEFEQEMKTTRRLLERVPDSAAQWAPHAKSMKMGELAQHIPSLVSWVRQVVTLPELDMNPPGGPPFKPEPFVSAAQMLSDFDHRVADARTVIAGASDAALGEPWSLKSGGHTIFTMPRSGVLRFFTMNHIIHHRGQLSVYLRLNDIPLPSIYGPTADER
jgi:uncharacterized damage-inducible protein DinB